MIHSLEKFKRNIGVLVLFMIGMPQADIARLYGIKRQRVKQILIERLGIKRKKWND